MYLLSRISNIVIVIFFFIINKYILKSTKFILKLKRKLPPVCLLGPVRLISLEKLSPMYAYLKVLSIWECRIIVYLCRYPQQILMVCKYVGILPKNKKNFMTNIWKLWLSSDDYWLNGYLRKIYLVVPYSQAAPITLKMTAPKFNLQNVVEALGPSPSGTFNILIENFRYFIIRF